jgi:hypothetical protein
MLIRRVCGTDVGRRAVVVTACKTRGNAACRAQAPAEKSSIGVLSPRFLAAERPKYRGESGESRAVVRKRRERRRKLNNGRRPRDLSPLYSVYCSTFFFRGGSAMTDFCARRLRDRLSVREAFRLPEGPRLRRSDLRHYRAVLSWLRLSGRPALPSGPVHLRQHCRGEWTVYKGRPYPTIPAQRPHASYR